MGHFSFNQSYRRFVKLFVKIIIIQLDIKIFQYGILSCHIQQMAYNKFAEWLIIVKLQHMDAFYYFVNCFNAVGFKMHKFNSNSMERNSNLHKTVVCVDYNAVFQYLAFFGTNMMFINNITDSVHSWIICSNGSCITF